MLSGAAACGILMIVAAAFLYLSPQLPSAETYKNVQLETPLRIYTADNKLIDEIGNHRNPVRFEDIPKVMIDALIATEDVRFYSHSGVDLQGLLRGFYGFIRGQNRGGGSTITMQLANNLSFDSDNVYLRKFKEIPFALQIQRELTKEEILTLYLNTIYFGAGADGIGAAAYIYYGKPVNELTLEEAAMMVSLLPCPSRCNPLNDPEVAKTRRETRLRNMLNERMITQAEFDQANASPVTAQRRNRNIEVDAPFIAEMVRQQLYDQFGEDTYTQGFQVITTLDSQKQQAARNALVNGLEENYDKKHGYRGVDAHFEVNETAPLETWSEQLQPVAVYGNQHPGIVTRVDDRSIQVLMKSGDVVTVEWEGMSWARPYISQNNAWPPPQSASDIVAIGDLIRLKQIENKWTLGQIPDIQAALVSMSPSTGEILALVGGYDFGRSQVNRAIQPRPPGSNFKPFVYGAALEQGYSPASTINDAPLTRNGYRPNNYDNTFMGPITLRFALQDSRNVPAVRLFDQLGWEAVFEFARKFGFRTENFPPNDLTVALGSQDVQPMEMVAAYSAIANGGFKVDPWFIKQISNLSEGEIYLSQPSVVCDELCETQQQQTGSEQIAPKAPRIIDAQVAFILNSMLRSAIEEGSGRGVQRALGRNDIMGKTGTTNGPQELWFSGFNRDLATTVFVGFDQPRPLGESEQGATVAVPIWIDYMREALADSPENTMPRPEGIVDRLVEKNTGRLARPGEPNTVFEYFREEFAPQSPENPAPGLDPTDDDAEISIETIF